MKKRERVPIETLLIEYPGVVHRRSEIIKALCRGCNLGGDNWQTIVLGRRIVEVANTIIEETEQPTWWVKK